MSWYVDGHGDACWMPDPEPVKDDKPTARDEADQKLVAAIKRLKEQRR